MMVPAQQREQLPFCCWRSQSGFEAFGLVRQWCHNDINRYFILLSVGNETHCSRRSSGNHFVNEFSILPLFLSSDKALNNQASLLAVRFASRTLIATGNSAPELRCIVSMPILIADLAVWIHRNLAVVFIIYVNWMPSRWPIAPGGIVGCKTRIRLLRRELATHKAID